MYLEHFGLNEPPFKITPVTDFFFPGANRLEILDALLYAITDSEGIIKVTGEVGSGKTMLCRMLLERAPEKVEAVYLANPSLTREEMLYAIADGLKLNLEGQRVNIILQTLQNHLEFKIAQGKRVVILVDEAHAMPLETMEELRLLYNLQVGSHKLLHIVLFGQPELNDKLSQPNMRQLKDRIIHHFSMLPLSQNIIESYLLFRMRTAGYRGPSPFTNSAAALIGKASQGLMRRVNILADKSLLAAFVENTHAVELRHVQAAIHDSELSPMSKNWWNSKVTYLYAISFILVLLLVGTSWLIGSRHNDTPVLTTTKPQLAPAQEVVTPTAALPNPGVPSVSAVIAPAPQTNIAENTTTTATPPPEEPAPLLTQRLEAAQTLLTKSSTGTASIQLYYTNQVRPARIEKFLKTAEMMGKLQEIYILPIKINSKQGLRVLYGIYANSKEARLAMQHLPKIYLEAYAPSIFVLDE
jgi:MSHA biogenesis protein MshM